MKNQKSQQSQLVRLNKFLAERLGVSRREADELIESGKITINGRTAKLGDKVDLPREREKAKLDLLSERREKDKIFEENLDKNDKVCYNGKIVPHAADFLYLAFNKPVGYVCSRRAQGPAPTLYDLLPKKYHHLKTVGRLDKDSSGLIILTNDGDFAFSMTHPSFRKNKVYEVELDKPLEPLHQQMISDMGVELPDGVSRFKVLSFGNGSCPNVSFSGRSGPLGQVLGPSKETFRPPISKCPSEEISPNHYTVILTEGRNRQIRRTFAALGYEVIKLHRTQFGPYELGDLKSGKYVIIEP